MHVRVDQPWDDESAFAIMGASSMAAINESRITTVREGSIVPDSESKTLTFSITSGGGAAFRGIVRPSVAKNAIVTAGILRGLKCFIIGGI
jgi:hypothetical protein